MFFKNLVDNLWSRSINGDAVDCKSAVLDMPGSIPGYSTISCIVLENSSVHLERHSQWVLRLASATNTVDVRRLWVMPVTVVTKVDQASTGAPYKLTR